MELQNTAKDFRITSALGLHPLIPEVLGPKGRCERPPEPPLPRLRQVFNMNA